jgi:hypothetical protein
MKFIALFMLAFLSLAGCETCVATVPDDAADIAVDTIDASTDTAPDAADIAVNESDAASED